MTAEIIFGTNRLVPVLLPTVRNFSPREPAGTILFFRPGHKNLKADMFYAPVVDLLFDLRFQIIETLYNAALDGMTTVAERRNVTRLISYLQIELRASKLQMIEAADGLF